MSSIGEHTEASSIEAELGRLRDDERSSPLVEVMVASADAGTRPVPARASVMASAEALLEYVSVGRTDSDRASAQWGSTGQIERQSNWATAQRGVRFSAVNTMNAADRRNSITDDGTAGKTELRSDDVAADRG